MLSDVNFRFGNKRFAFVKGCILLSYSFAHTNYCADKTLTESEICYTNCYSQTN